MILTFTVLLFEEVSSLGGQVPNGSVRCAARHFLHVIDFAVWRPRRPVIGMARTKLAIPVSDAPNRTAPGQLARASFHRSRRGRIPAASATHPKLFFICCDTSVSPPLAIKSRARVFHTIVAGGLCLAAPNTFLIKNILENFSFLDIWTSGGLDPRLLGPSFFFLTLFSNRLIYESHCDFLWIAKIYVRRINR